MLRRHQVREGHSASYKKKMARRLRQICKQGFDVARFWSTGVDVAEELALDWMQDQEEAGRSLHALDNYAKVVNLLSIVAGHQGFRRLKMRAPKHLLRLSLQPDMIEHVLDNYHHNKPVFRVRNMAIFVVNQILAQRRGEVSRMDLRDLDRDRGRVYVKASKNYLHDWMPVEDDLWPYIEAWLQVRPTPAEDPDALFVTLHGECKRLEPRGVYLVLRKIGAQLGLQLNSNVLRHTRNRRLRLHGHPASMRRHFLRHTNEQALVHYDEEEYEDIEHQFRLIGGPGLRGDPRARPAVCPTCGQRRKPRQ